MNPAERLIRSAKREPDAVALMQGERVVADYATFAKRAAAIGGALKAQYGIKPNDRVALFMTNCTAYLEVLYGVWFAGAVVVPINAKLHAREAAWIIEDSGAAIVFVTAAVAAGFEAEKPNNVRAVILTGSEDYDALYQGAPLLAPSPTKDDDPIWLFYTSGTTGKPKGVILTSANLQAMTTAYLSDVDDVSSDDAILYAAPMSHGAGIYNFMHVLRGARHVVPDSAGFNPAEILEIAPRLGNVSMFAAPTMVRRLVDRAAAEAANGEGIKTIIYGGGPMYVADIEEAVNVMGPRFVQIYGQGECPMAITVLSRAQVADRTHPDWRRRLGSVGVAQSCVKVRIADEFGAERPAGEIGEILVQGTPVMAGYWHNQAATKSAVRDGWLWTGDMGVMDADGFLTLHDRSKDVIISGGSNIYPREVEETLLTHPGVYEVAVVGRPHADWGEEVIAFIVPEAGAELSEAELDEHCLQEIARFKRPKAYRIIPELPKNNYGKVLKTALRGLLNKEK